MIVFAMGLRQSAVHTSGMFRVHSLFRLSIPKMKRVGESKFLKNSGFRPSFHCLGINLFTNHLRRYVLILNAECTSYRNVRYREIFTAVFCTEVLVVTSLGELMSNGIKSLAMSR